MGVCRARLCPRWPNFRESVLLLLLARNPWEGEKAYATLSALVLHRHAGDLECCPGRHDLLYLWNRSGNHREVRRSRKISLVFRNIILTMLPALLRPATVLHQC